MTITQPGYRILMNIWAVVRTKLETLLFSFPHLSTLYLLNQMPKQFTHFKKKTRMIAYHPCFHKIWLFSICQKTQTPSCAWKQPSPAQNSLERTVIVELVSTNLDTLLLSVLCSICPEEVPCSLHFVRHTYRSLSHMLAEREGE